MTIKGKNIHKIVFPLAVMILLCGNLYGAKSKNKEKENNKQETTVTDTVAAQDTILKAAKNVRTKTLNEVMRRDTITASDTTLNVEMNYLFMVLDAFNKEKRTEAYRVLNDSLMAKLEPDKIPKSKTSIFFHTLFHLGKYTCSPYHTTLILFRGLFYAVIIIFSIIFLITVFFKKSLPTPNK